MSSAGAPEVGEDHLLRTLDDLDRHYGEASPRSLTKEIAFVNDAYRALIAASPFVVIATAGPEGLDASPRGDPPGFVEVDEDGRTLFLPDRPGNNRVDSLRNIVRDPRVGLIFLVPGLGETLRVNGRAEISVDPTLLSRFSMNGKLPRSVIRVAVESVYFQCQKAIVRSRLWSAEAQVTKGALPSAGRMLAATDEAFDAGAYDREAPARMAQTIY